MLKVIGLGEAPIVHHDYLVYERLALNLIDHHVFSMNETTATRSDDVSVTLVIRAFIAGVYFARRSKYDDGRDCAIRTLGC